MVKKLLIASSASLSGLFMSAAVLAAPAYTLFGDATIVAGGNPGNATQLVSDAAPGYGGVDIDVPAGTTWTDLATLSTDYNVTDDDCGGGSPRFQINVDTNNDGISDGNVQVAIGPSPSFTDCLSGWQSTGNLIGNEDAGRYDYSQFGGSPFTTYSNAPASVLAGTVVGVQLVVDGSWNAAATGGDGEQTILVDNINLNGGIITFEPEPTKDSCKKGGWASMTDSSGNAFKNQGDCVSYFSTGGKNKAAGN